MKTKGLCWPKTLLLEDMNGHREQSINIEKASTKTEYQLNQRKHWLELHFILESMGLCMGGKNQGKLRSQICNSNIQMRAIKESDYSKTNFLWRTKHGYIITESQQPKGYQWQAKCGLANVPENVSFLFSVSAFSCLFSQATNHQNHFLSQSPFSSLSQKHAQNLYKKIMKNLHLQLALPVKGSFLQNISENQPPKSPHSQIIACCL